MADAQFNGSASGGAASGGPVKIIYVLYLLGLIIGITPIIALVMAYIYRDGAPEWLYSHYTFQIRTFWIGLLYVVIGLVTTFILIGWLVLLFWLVWYLVRCIKGLKLAGEQRGIDHARTWWF
ncbi:MAG TPA: hypothetical protein VIJ42_17130 [Stellaceae bacterium]